MNSLFCRHNRFTADCPICSKGTVLDPGRAARPRPAAAPAPARARRQRVPPPGAVRSVAGPYVACGPYARDDGSRYEVRLERVPGGVRVGQWAEGALERRAPVLSAADMPGLVAALDERGVLPASDLESLERALAEPVVTPTAAERHGTSPGRTGDLREELRIEAADDAMIRIARWIFRPNAGWELQESPPMLPAKRYAQALSEAVRRGVVPGSPPPAARHQQKSDPRAGGA